MNIASTVLRSGLWWMLWALVWVTASAFADCPDPALTEPVQQLLAANDVPSLDRTFARLDRTHDALIAVHRKRRLDLSPTRAEEKRFLQSLPRTRAQLRRVYALSYTTAVCEHPVVSDVVYGMFDTAARIVRAHQKGYDRFIALCELTDGELGEVAWVAYDELLERDTAHVLAALRAMPFQRRKGICDDRDPRGLSDQEAAERCASGL